MDVSLIRPQARWFLVVRYGFTENYDAIQELADVLSSADTAWFAKFGQPFGAGVAALLRSRDREDTSYATRSRDHMITVLDIFRSANILLEQHGDDAEHVAQARADSFLARGELEGHDVWMRIVDAIDVLRRDKPKAREQRTELKTRGF